MTYEQLIEHFGSQAAAAKALGVTRAAVLFWRNTGIPKTRQFQIEVVTKGALKAVPVSDQSNRAA